MTTPMIYVLARPSFTKEFANFLDSQNQSWRNTSTLPAEQLIEFAGRICYMSFGSRQSPKTNQDYIRHLILQGHESVLEHANWTLLLTGITRSFTHQLVRHRAGMSFSQLSQQYHEETDTHFVVPPSLSNDPKLLKTWTDAVESSRRAYRSILGSLLTNNNQSKEAKRAILSAARSVLPNATETKIVVTANARAIRHFLQLRGAIEGDVEMRQVSKLLYDVIMRDAPALVPDFECTILQDGSHMIKKIDPQRKSG